MKQLLLALIALTSIPLFGMEEQPTAAPTTLAKLVISCKTGDARRRLHISLGKDSSTPQVYTRELGGFSERQVQKSRKHGGIIDPDPDGIMLCAYPQQRGILFEETNPGLVDFKADDFGTVSHLTNRYCTFATLIHHGQKSIPLFSGLVETCFEKATESDPAKFFLEIAEGTNGQMVIHEPEKFVYEIDNQVE